MRVRCESLAFVSISVRATDGALEFDEQGGESNSNRAKPGFHNRIAPATGDDFLWILSLFVQRKYLALSESEMTHIKPGYRVALRLPGMTGGACIALARYDGGWSYRCSQPSSFRACAYI